MRDAAAASGGLRRLRPFVPAAGGWVRGAAAAEGAAGALRGRPVWPSPVQPARPCPAAGRARRRIHVRVRTVRGAGEKMEGPGRQCGCSRGPGARARGPGRGWGRRPGGVSGVQKGAERRRRRGPGLTGRCHGAMRRGGGAFTRASRAHTAGSAACGVGPRSGSPLSGRGGEWKGGRHANRVFGLGVEAGRAHRPRTPGQAREQPLGAGPPPTVLICCESRG